MKLAKGLFKNAGFVIGFVLFIGTLLIAAFGPLLAKYDAHTRVGLPYLPPSGEHILGTDHMGVDMLAMLMAGLQSSLYVGFLASAPPAAAVRALRACATAVDDFRVVGREVYWLCRTSFGQSEFSGARLEKVLSAATTVRNITTVRRIADKLAA